MQTVTVMVSLTEAEYCSSRWALTTGASRLPTCCKRHWIWALPICCGKRKRGAGP